MDNFKKGKVLAISKEFKISKDSLQYELNGVDISKSFIGYKTDYTPVEEMPKGAYSIIEEGNNQYLKITDSTIMDDDPMDLTKYPYTSIQILEEIPFKSSPYNPTGDPDINTMVTYINQIADDVILMADYLKKTNAVVDTSAMTNVLTELSPHTTWYMDDDGIIKAMPVDELFNGFNTMIDKAYNFITDKLKADYDQWKTSITKYLLELQATIEASMKQLSATEQQNMQTLADKLKKEIGDLGDQWKLDLKALYDQYIQTMTNHGNTLTNKIIETGDTWNKTVISTGETKKAEVTAEGDKKIQEIKDLVVDKTGEFNDLVSQSKTDITNLTNSSKTDITNLTDTKKQEITQLGDTYLTNIENAGKEAVDDVEAKRDELVKDITDTANKGIEDITNVKDTATSEITNTKNEAVTTITNTKTETITEITNIKTETITEVNKVKDEAIKGVEDTRDSVVKDVTDAGDKAQDDLQDLFNKLGGGIRPEGVWTITQAGHGFTNTPVTWNETTKLFEKSDPTNSKFADALAVKKSDDEFYLCFGGTGIAVEGLTVDTWYYLGADGSLATEPDSRYYQEICYVKTDVIANEDGSSSEITKALVYVSQPIDCQPATTDEDGHFKDFLTSGSIDTTMPTTPTDNKIPSTKMIKEYVDNKTPTLPDNLLTTDNVDKTMPDSPLDTQVPSTKLLKSYVDANAGGSANELLLPASLKTEDGVEIAKIIAIDDILDLSSESIGFKLGENGEFVLNAGIGTGNDPHTYLGINANGLTFNTKTDISSETEFVIGRNSSSFLSGGSIDILSGGVFKIRVELYGGGSMDVIRAEKGGKLNLLTPELYTSIKNLSGDDKDLISVVNKLISGEIGGGGTKYNVTYEITIDGTKTSEVIQVAKGDKIPSYTKTEFDSAKSFTITPESNIENGRVYGDITVSGGVIDRTKVKLKLSVTAQSGASDVNCSLQGNSGIIKKLKTGNSYEIELEVGKWYSLVSVNPETFLGYVITAKSYENISKPSLSINKYLEFYIGEYHENCSLDIEIEDMDKTKVNVVFKLRDLDRLSTYQLEDSKGNKIFSNWYPETLEEQKKEELTVGETYYISDGLNGNGGAGACYMEIDGVSLTNFTINAWQKDDVVVLLYYSID